MLVSGFVDGRLIYILEFPFSCPSLLRNLKKQLLRRFPNGKDIPTEYLRSASFYYRDFIECENLKIVYLLDKRQLMDFKPYIVRDFYKFLEANAK